MSEQQENPHVELNQYEADPYWQQQSDLVNSYKDNQAIDDTDEIENSEAAIQSKESLDNRRETEKAVKGGPGDHSWGGYENQQTGTTPGEGVQKPAHVSQEDWDNRPKWSRPLEDILHAGSASALGLADFASDAIGLVPWLKPIDNWWDNNSPRHNHPAIKLTRDASSIIIPAYYGGAAVTAKARSATAFANIPSWAKTLGSVAAYTGVDTGVAMISSHSKTDDNMAATLNNWLGWGLPWATLPGDSPDVRWKKNVFENAGFAGAAELLGVAFAMAPRVKKIPRDNTARAILENQRNELSQYAEPVTAVVEGQRVARQAAQTEEMIDVLKRDPTGEQGYNAFVNDLGEDTAGKVITDIDADPLMAKLDQTRIQGSLGTFNGRATPVAGPVFQKKLMRAFNGNERAQQLDQLFNAITPNFDAVVPVGDKTIRVTAEQMNRSIDNLTEALYAKDLSFGEFQVLVDDMKKVVFNSNAVLDEQSWLEYSKSFKNAYDILFDPNQVRASAMLTQQTGDSITDLATAAMMMGDNADASRQFQLIFEKLNLLDTEMSANKFIFNKAQEYRKLISTGNDQVVVSWMRNQADTFDTYLSHIRKTNDDFSNTLWNIAKEDPAYFRPLKEVFAHTNGSVDQIHKLKKYAESKLGILKKGIMDGEPEVSSVIVKGLHAARIHSLLSGLSAGRAAIGNMTLTALKPISVLAGSKLTGQDAVFKRAMYTYGGLMENFRRGFKVMQSEWNFAKNFPEEAMMRGRVDLQKAKMDKLEELEGMAEIWRRDGDKAKIAVWNMAKGLGWYNKQWFVKYGTNALYAIDGFTNSFMASGMARARAYDKTLHANRGAVKFDDFFNKTQRDLYSQAFDEAGVLVDDAAKHASREIALNLDNKVVDSFERFLDHVPAARGVFMFPRTGVNGFEVGWSFNPLSNIGPAMTRARKTLDATTGEAKMAALLEHGIDASQDANLAFETLRSEYIGRQIMGSALVMGIGAWAIDGNVTGAGPQNDAERRRMVAMGWKPFSIRNPITGEWRSYAGIEPFAGIMGLTADIVYQASRVDQSITEDSLRKIGHAITMNVTNGMFIQGFEPLAGLISADPSAWTRFFAQQTNMVLPYAGVRSVLNNVVAPQVKDVNNDYFSILKNMNKFLFAADPELPNKLDIYTGEPIKTWHPLVQATNAILPMFKSNGGMEPFRQWLLSTGWDGLQRIRTNKYTGMPLTARERQYINNHIGKNAGLKAQIIDLMTKDDGWYDKKIKEYKKERGFSSQREMPIKELIVHKELDAIHDRAFDAALADFEMNNSQFTEVGREIYNKKRELNQGNIKRAKKTNQRVNKLLRDTRNK